VLIPRLARVALAAVTAVLLTPGCASPALGPPPRPGAGLALSVAASGLDQPLYATAPVGDRRLFIVEQPGVVRILRDGKVLPAPYLDIRDRVRSGGERGLLSIAFHPHYATNGFVFVNYTDHEGDTRVVRFTVSADPDRADPATAKFVLHVAQPYANHNGGHILFGPDSMLYIGMGDGGSAGDPHGNGQDRRTLLGDLLRIDVDHGDPYAIPRDNPWAHAAGKRPEVWAYGLRNPWRIAFDSGLLYIADVGQNQWEEIDVAPARQPGIDYGWNLLEGNHAFRSARSGWWGHAPLPPELRAPAIEYSHAEGCSVIGGRVYRGPIAALRGLYFYADECSGWIESFRWRNGRAEERTRWLARRGLSPTAFGADARGELYLLDLGGKVYRIAGAH
jgi:glucose/arabinose dehydrogenase